MRTLSPGSAATHVLEQMLGRTPTTVPALALAAVLALLLALPQPVRAAEGKRVTRSYVTPFPENDVYNVHVFGDSLADALASGLVQAFRKQPRIKVHRKSRPGTGLVRPDIYDWQKAVEAVTRNETVHIAVVLFGTADRRTIYAGGRAYRLGSDKWQAEYGRRVDRFIRVLKREGAAIYWVGLPIMKSPKANRDMQMINEVVRERAYVNGIKFVDTWTGFTDPSGQYDPFGPDLAGKIRRLRAKDGVHFTPAGERKLAHFVEREIRRDLALAKAEQNVPLAGSEEEQARIRRSREALRAGREGSGDAKSAKGRRGGESLERKAEHSRITLELPNASGKKVPVTIPILRPTIPAAVMAHVMRRGSTGLPTMVGRSVLGDLDGGLTALSSISPVGAVTRGQRKGAVPLTQMPYYKVLVKGEALPPKPGRADDFRWPRRLASPAG